MVNNDIKYDEEDGGMKTYNFACQVCRTMRGWLCTGSTPRFRWRHSSSPRSWYNRAGVLWRDITWVFMYRCKFLPTPLRVQIVSMLLFRSLKIDDKYIYKIYKFYAKCLYIFSSLLLISCGCATFQLYVWCIIAEFVVYTGRMAEWSKALVLGTSLRAWVRIPLLSSVDTNNLILLILK
jgi:hypothetical protein